MPISLKHPETKKSGCFDILVTEVGGGYAYYPLDVTGLIHAEQAQRNFVQTLTKTLAHPSLDLAIFDQQRKLILFKPSLIDLTCLGTDFLGAKPDLISVFGCLRDSQIMPEPKDYAD